MSATSPVGPEILDEAGSAIRATFERIEESYQSFGRIDSAALTDLLHTLVALKPLRPQIVNGKDSAPVQPAAGSPDQRVPAICKEIQQAALGAPTDPHTLCARILEHRDFPTLRALLETRFFEAILWNPIKKRAGELGWYDGYRLLNEACPSSNFQLPLAVAWRMRDPTAVFGAGACLPTHAADKLPVSEAQQALDRTLDEFVVFLSESAFSPAEMNTVLRSHVQKTVSQVTTTTET